MRLTGSLSLIRCCNFEIQYNQIYLSKIVAIPELVYILLEFLLADNINISPPFKEKNGCSILAISSRTEDILMLSANKNSSCSCFTGRNVFNLISFRVSGINYNIGILECFKNILWITQKFFGYQEFLIGY